MADLDVSTVREGDVLEITRDRVLTVTMPGGRRTTMTIDSGTLVRVRRVSMSLMDLHVGVGIAEGCDNHNLAKVDAYVAKEMPADARVWGRRA